MVRGDPRCPHFCTDCQVDCRCQRASCLYCHTCRHIATRHACGIYVHDCKDHVKEKDELDTQKEEKLKKEISIKVADFPMLFSSEIIKITVGGETSAQIRHVPKHVLTEHSEYFKSLFAFQEKSGGEPPVSLVLDTDVDHPEAFDCFIQFAYWKDYHIKYDDKMNLACIAFHARVYVLADRLQAMPLKQAAVRKASERAVNSVRSDILATPQRYKELLVSIISNVYSNTPPPPPPEVKENEDHPEPHIDRFRYLLVAIAARRLDSLRNSDSFNACLKAFPDFAVDLIAQLTERAPLKLDDDGYVL